MNWLNQNVVSLGRADLLPDCGFVSAKDLTSRVTEASRDAMTPVMAVKTIP